MRWFNFCLRLTSIFSPDCFLNVVFFLTAVGNFQTCNLARIPSRVVMGRSGDELKAVKKSLLHLYEFLQLKQDIFQLFNSSAYGHKDLLFKDSTVKLIDIREKNSTEAWLGEMYYQALRILHSCQTKAASARSCGDELKTFEGGRLFCLELAIILSILWFA